jgi:hypothetical protein
LSFRSLASATLALASVVDLAADSLQPSTCALGETDHVSRKTVSKYRAWAKQPDMVSGVLPDPVTLQAQLKATSPVSAPPATLSK